MADWMDVWRDGWMNGWMDGFPESTNKFGLEPLVFLMVFNQPKMSFLSAFLDCRNQQWSTDLRRK
jgi:hypothetical protein